MENEMSNTSRDSYAEARSSFLSFLGLGSWISSSAANRTDTPREDDDRDEQKKRYNDRDSFLPGADNVVLSTQGSYEPLHKRALETVDQDVFKPFHRLRESQISTVQRTPFVDVLNGQHRTFSKREVFPFFEMEEARNDAVIDSSGHIASGIVFGDVTKQRDRYERAIRYTDANLPKENIGRGLNVDLDVTASGGFHDPFRILEEQRRREYMPAVCITDQLPFQEVRSVDSRDWSLQPYDRPKNTKPRNFVSDGNDRSNVALPVKTEDASLVSFFDPNRLKARIDHPGIGTNTHSRISNDHPGLVTRRSEPFSGRPIRTGNSPDQYTFDRPSLSFPMYSHENSFAVLPMSSTEKEKLKNNFFFPVSSNVGKKSTVSNFSIDDQEGHHESGTFRRGRKSLNIHKEEIRNSEPVYHLALSKNEIASLKNHELESMKDKTPRSSKTRGEIQNRLGCTNVTVQTYSDIVPVSTFEKKTIPNRIFDMVQVQDVHPSNDGNNNTPSTYVESRKEPISLRFPVIHNRTFQTSDLLTRGSEISNNNCRRNSTNTTLDEREGIKRISLQAFFLPHGSVQTREDSKRKHSNFDGLRFANVKQQDAPTNENGGIKASVNSRAVVKRAFASDHDSHAFINPFCTFLKDKPLQTILTSFPVKNNVNSKKPHVEDRIPHGKRSSSTRNDENESTLPKKKTVTFSNELEPWMTSHPSFDQRFKRSGVHSVSQRKGEDTSHFGRVWANAPKATPSKEMIEPSRDRQ